MDESAPITKEVKVLASKSSSCSGKVLEPKSKTISSLSGSKICAKRGGSEYISVVLDGIKLENGQCPAGYERCSSQES